MIDTPTVFILGAGASKPYGYSTAAGLRELIINDYRNKLQALIVEVGIKNPTLSTFIHDAQEFVDAFRRSNIESVDKFLSLNPSFKGEGKRAITLSILHEEQKSNFPNASEDWYKLLFNRMISELKEPSDFVKFRENKVAFITFNYDRSFEHFLYDSFLHAFWDRRHDFEPSINEFIPFPIIHVYGQVDKTMWNGGSDYKAKCDFLKINKLSENIRVIGEVSGAFFKEKIAAILSEYKKIFFLGFRYAKENMDVIGMPGFVNENWNMFGTAYGMTKREIDNVKRTFTNNFTDKGARRINPRIEDKTSYELLREYL
jgi:hypothetical protein